ncbi:hypothetical protein ISN39_14595 [Rhizobium sp. 007]|nr:hypothetical protein ISN39_14595 [Rhizobium sp. 007]
MPITVSGADSNAKVVCPQLIDKRVDRICKTDDDKRQWRNNENEAGHNNDSGDNDWPVSEKS